MPPKLREKPLSKTERQRRYREKRKKDPERHKKALEYERERKKMERIQVNLAAAKNHKKAEEKKKQKRDEMRRYREKKKTKTAGTTVPETSRQDAAVTREKRKKDKFRKHLERELIKTHKMVHLEKARNYRLRLKLTGRNLNYPVPSSEDADGTPAPILSPFSSRTAEYRAQRKVKNALPSTPQKKAHLVEKLIDSPNTAQILNRKGRILSQNMARRLKMGELVVSSLKTCVKQTMSKGTRSHDKMAAYRSVSQLAACHLAAHYGIRSSLMKACGIRKLPKRDEHWWKSRSRKLRKDSLPQSIRDDISAFFLSGEVSRENPGKKFVLQIDGNKVQRHSMTMTLQEAYKLFKEKYQNHHVGFTLFRKCKPIQVNKVSETNRRTCLCMQCCNMALKCEALKKMTNAEITTKKEDLARMTICESEPTKACYKRTCPKCLSVKEVIEEHFANQLSEAEGDVDWARWEYVNLQKDDKVKRVVSCVPKKTSMKELIEALTCDLSTFPGHAFRANWQHQQMKQCLETLPPDEAMLVMDFSENYCCRYREEVASAFFDQVQVTIHPMMMYYRIDGRLVKHAIIAISDDLTHDSYAVKAFEDLAFKQVITRMPITKVHEWSDGCAVQYKAKTAFSILAARANTNIKVRRNFFETSHGKSVCDGLGAITKNSAHQAVVSGRCIIAGAKDLHAHCVKTLAHETREVKADEDSIRQFLFVESCSIKRNSHTNARPLPGTRRIHSFEGTDGISVRVRELSCYCVGCRLGDGPCLNVHLVAPWEERHLPVITSSQEKSNKLLRRPKLPEAFVPSHPDRTMFADGTFVAVKQTTRSTTSRKTPSSVLVCVGKIVEVDENDACIRYMKKTGDLFIWPEKDDTAWTSVSQIVCTVQRPELANKRKQFRFKDLDDINRAIGSVKTVIRFI